MGVSIFNAVKLMKYKNIIIKILYHILWINKTDWYRWQVRLLLLNF